MRFAVVLIPAMNAGKQPECLWRNDGSQPKRKEFVLPVLSLITWFGNVRNLSSVVPAEDVIISLFVQDQKKALTLMDSRKMTVPLR